MNYVSIAALIIVIGILIGYLLLLKKQVDETLEIIGQAIEWEKVKLEGEFIFYADLEILLEGADIKRVKYIKGGFLGKEGELFVPRLWMMGARLQDLSKDSLLGLIKKKEISVRGIQTFDLLITFSVTKNGINVFYGRQGHL